MPQKRVLITYKLSDDVLTPLRDCCELEVWSEDRPMTSVELQSSITNCDGIICFLTDQITVSVLDRAKKLKFISSMSVGVDHIDVGAANDRGIPIGNTPGVLAETTADTAFGLLLASARRISEADRYIREGSWRPELPWSPEFFLGKDVHGAILGVVGLGQTGRAVTRRGKAFDMQVLGWNRTPQEIDSAECVTLSELLRKSDFVSINIAKNSDSTLFFNRERIMSMKKGAILINTSRGGIVDEEALSDALMMGHLAGAGFDVFENEPINLDNRLLKLPNVVLTPHIGSATSATRKNMASLAVRNALAAIDGTQMPFCVNPAVYLAN